MPEESQVQDEQAPKPDTEPVVENENAEQAPAAEEAPAAEQGKLLSSLTCETNFIFFIETTQQSDQAEEEAAQIENEKPLAPKESQSDADREKTIDIE